MQPPQTPLMARKLRRWVQAGRHLSPNLQSPNIFGVGSLRDRAKLLWTSVAQSEPKEGKATSTSRFSLSFSFSCLWAANKWPFESNKLLPQAALELGSVELLSVSLLAQHNLSQPFSAKDMHNRVTLINIAKAGRKGRKLNWSTKLAFTRNDWLIFSQQLD